jgi:hypothetical protein
MTSDMPSRIPDPATDEVDPENPPEYKRIFFRGPEYWWGDRTESQDETHIMMLNPAWLEQFKEEQQKEVFFHCILPILTLRFDEDNPEKEPLRIEPDIKAFWTYIRRQNWESLPLQPL